MLKRSWLVGAAVFLAAAAVDARAGGQAQSNSTNTRAQQEPLTLPQGATSVRLNEGEQIRDTLGAVLNSIVTDDEFRDVVNFESMVDHLAAPDRRRIGNVDAGRLRQLTTTVRGLRDVWKQRFAGQQALGDFNEDTVFGNVQIAEGRIADPAALAAHWPVTGPSREAGAAKPVGTTGGFFEKPGHRRCPAASPDRSACDCVFDQ